MEILNNINVILQIISNICIVGITLYTAFLQFYHKSVKYLGYSYNTRLCHNKWLILTRNSV